MKNILLYLLHILLCIVLAVHFGCRKEEPTKKSVTNAQQPIKIKHRRVLIPTFLGNEKRKFYGIGPVPHPLTVRWKLKIGGDSTRIGKRTVKWYGTGWTGQPSFVCDEGREYLIIGGYDHESVAE